jgi:hypothetical protein
MGSSYPRSPVELLSDEILRSGRNVYHRCGILMTMKGEKVILHGSGISITVKGPGMSMRGLHYSRTTSPSFSRLNNVSLVFGIGIMPGGTIHDRMWGWK